MSSSTRLAPGPSNEEAPRERLQHHRRRHLTRVLRHVTPRPPVRCKDGQITSAERLTRVKHAHAPPLDGRAWHDVFAPEAADVDQLEEARDPIT